MKISNPTGTARDNKGKMHAKNIIRKKAKSVFIKRYVDVGMCYDSFVAGYLEGRHSMKRRISEFEDSKKVHDESRKEL